MKPKTFLFALLFLPYVIWLVSVRISLLLDNATRNYSALSPMFEFLTLLALFFGSGIIFWGIPYTVLVIGLLIWSRKKPSKSVYRALFFSPLLLAALIVIGLLISLLLIPAISNARLPSLEDWVNLIGSSVVATIISLIVGYVFVGLGTVMYSILEYLKVVKSDADDLDVKSMAT